MFSFKIRDLNDLWRLWEKINLHIKEYINFIIYNT